MSTHPNDYPVVTQTWVDDGGGNPSQAKSEFVILPVVFKADAEQIQTLKIVHTGEEMPQDRESFFWINLYETPGKTKEQMKPLEQNEARLTLAMNTQLKIFYRPKSLEKMNLEKIVSMLKLSVVQKDGQSELICENLSPYNVSFSGIVAVYKDESVNFEQNMDMMTQVLTTRAYTLPNTKHAVLPEKISFGVLNDQGQVYSGDFDLQTQQVVLNMN